MKMMEPYSRRARERHGHAGQDAGPSMGMTTGTASGCGWRPGRGCFLHFQAQLTISCTVRTVKGRLMKIIATSTPQGV